MEKKPTRLIPCDMPPPQSNVQEGPGGWYTIPWTEAEKKAYKRAALMKPDEERVPK